MERDRGCQDGMVPVIGMILLVAITFVLVAIISVVVIWR